MQLSATRAATSAPQPPVSVSSCTMIKRPVRLTDSKTVSQSNGTNVLTSITSASILCSASVFAASRDLCTIRRLATIVTSLPCRTRLGRDVTIVANLLMVHKSLLAAKTLAEQGIEAEVIDVRTLVPFDWETVFESVSRTGRLIIVHEDTLTGGWGAEVAARVADSCIGYLQGPIRRVTAPDTPVPFAPVMENFFVPSVEKIVNAVKEICQ